MVLKSDVQAHGRVKQEIGVLREVQRDVQIFPLRDVQVMFMF